MLQQKKILLGVCGGIAAYKAVLLLRLLRKAGAEVKVVMTPSALNFVGKMTFSALSGNEVYVDMWEETGSKHVELGLWADLMVVAPATSATMAKMVNGLSDNALLTTYMSAKCPVLLAPAMDLDMYKHPATLRKIETLRAYGNFVLPSGEGYLASGLEGMGRMAEPEEILEAVVGALTPKLLAGKKVLITAGPTQEALDPVRYISNHSTGKMGVALAVEAKRMGAEVTLLVGPTHIPLPQGVKVVKIVSARDMLQAAQQHAPQQDLMIYAAAVADYTPETVSDLKIKKKTDDFQLSLVKTADVLASISQAKLPHQRIVGFALETNNALEHARQKLVKKNLDMVVLNTLQDAGAGFGHDTNKITLLHKDGRVQEFPLKAKTEVAQDILAAIIQQMG